MSLPLPQTSALPNNHIYSKYQRNLRNLQANTGSLPDGFTIKDFKPIPEALKKREAWMKAALTKATRSGFVYPEGEDIESDADDDDIDTRKVAEMVMSLKHFKAKIQVSLTPI